jgi:hypothetical protein
MTITACLFTHVGEFVWPFPASPNTDLLRRKVSVAHAVASVAGNDCRRCIATGQFPSMRHAVAPGLLGFSTNSPVALH